MLIHYLTLADIEYICFSIVQRSYQFDEPIPPFQTRFESKLESILEIPKQGITNQELYPTLIDKATCYFYFIIKDHPFLNGNKRLSIVSTYVFMGLNGYNFEAPWQDIYSLAMNVARSSSSQKNYYFQLIKDIISKNRIKDISH